MLGFALAFVSLAECEDVWGFRVYLHFANLRCGCKRVCVWCAHACSHVQSQLHIRIRRQRRHNAPRGAAMCVISFLHCVRVDHRARRHRRRRGATSTQFYIHAFGQRIAQNALRTTRRVCLCGSVCVCAPVLIAQYYKN